MKEVLERGFCLPEAYHNALEALNEIGEISDCPDYNQKQKELSMTMYVEEALTEPMISSLFIGGFEELEQYRQEMLDGILDFRIGHGWDYTYHSRMQEQYSFLISELKRNKDSRRAVIDIRDWKKDITSTSPACLQNMQFFIRNNKLHLKVLMRSNDATEATFMNAFAFIMFQKKIADELGVAVGSYVHRANSFHCYEKDFKMLEGYVKAIKEKKLNDISYNYVGYFDEMMQESLPNIKLKIEQVRAGLN